MISKEKFYGKRNYNKNGGITLIALVITIIVLLILAGVTIAALSGDNGILTRAKEAKEETEQAQKKEEQTLLNMENILNNATSFNNINVADTNPAGAMPSNVTILESDANKGIVIKDKKNNEWVWIEVPKTTVFADLTIDMSNTLTEENYTAIKNKLIAYAETYREGKLGQGYNWTDEWYEGCGLTSNEYTEIYRKMLKSVYVYGGFWIGRYEAGIEGSIDDVSKARTSHSAITIGISPKAISQKDAIPYNYVYCSEAQILAKEMTPDSNYTSSLMFGIQWDLVCKFLEVKSGLTTAGINSDSSTWGNYNNVTRTVTSKKAKQSIDYGSTWKVITGIKQASSILLTTGASDETSKMNIYEFAGNEYEWTLEHATSVSGSPCAIRGGNYYNNGSYTPAADRYNYGITSSYNYIGFRSTFYVN